MAITTSLSNGQRTVTLTYTAENTKVLSLLTDAAKWNYEVKKKFQVNSKVWDELTTLEKRQYYFAQNITPAQAAVKATGEATYDL